MSARESGELDPREQAERDMKAKAVREWLVQLAQDNLTGHGTGARSVESGKVRQVVDVWHDLTLVEQKLLCVAFRDLVPAIRKESEGGIDPVEALPEE